ncbi:MAG TPA: hypothetical protein VFD36_05335 [Kofleriaceae bacterium]|jgi:hypothetical protein|nr:hypothetical protein [Kofleriaceae bacterium]
MATFRKKLDREAEFVRGLHLAQGNADRKSTMPLRANVRRAPRARASCSSPRPTRTPR